MKTSNKLLIGLAAVMFCAPTFIFLSFRYKLDHGDFTTGNPFDDREAIHLPPFRVLELAEGSHVNVQQDTASFLIGEGIIRRKTPTGNGLSGQKTLLDYEQHGDTLIFSHYWGSEIHVGPGVGLIISDSGEVDYFPKGSTSSAAPGFLMRQSNFRLLPADGSNTYVDSLNIRSSGDASIQMDGSCSVGLLSVDLTGPVNLDLSQGHVNELRITGGDSAMLNVPGYLLKDLYGAGKPQSQRR